LKKHNLATLGYQNQRLRGAGSGELPELRDFRKFVTEITHFKHIAAKIQPKNI